MIVKKGKNMGRIIGTAAIALIAVASFIFSYRQYHEKGSPLNNAYIYASETERKKMDKKPYYRQSAIVFLLVGMIFSVSAVDMFCRTSWLIYCVLALAAITIVYAILSSIKIRKE